MSFSAVKHLCLGFEAVALGGLQENTLGGG